MEKDREKHRDDLKKLQNQIATLTQTIQRNESVIIMLKQQLASKQKMEEVSYAIYMHIACTKRHETVFYLMNPPGWQVSW